jgi:hypothetical protein
VNIDHLIFDTSSATSDQDTHNIGAYVRSGKSSALITHHALFKLPASPFSFADGDVSVANNTITEVAHGYRTGDLVQLTTTGVLPAGLALLTDYYVIRVDADTIKLAISQFNAEYAIAVDITAAAGGGTHTVTGMTQDIRSLDVFAAIADGEGNKITSTAGSLNVNLTNSPVFDVQVDGVYSGSNLDPDNIGLIVHVRGAAPVDADQTYRSTGASPSADNIDPANVHALDMNSFGMMWDGTAWDRMTGASATGLNVNITNATLAVTQSTSPWVVSDAALANTAILSAAETLDVADTSQNAVVSPLANRKYLWIYNNDNQSMAIGGPGVTMADGFPISPRAYMELRAGAAVDLEFVSAKLNHEIRTLELS